MPRLFTPFRQRNERKKDTQHIGQAEELRGERVYIRPPCFEELSFIRALWADPETMEPVGGPHHLPEARAKTWFASMVDPGNLTNCYCLIFNQENIPIGEISFQRWNQRERSAELNIKVLAKYRSNGYGMDALRTFIAWFFGPVGGGMMTDNVALDNQRGQQLLLTLGFERDADISDVCMLLITKQIFISKYGEPTKCFAVDRAGAYLR